MAKGVLYVRAMCVQALGAIHATSAWRGCASRAPDTIDRRREWHGAFDVIAPAPRANRFGKTTFHILPPKFQPLAKVDERGDRT